MVNKSVLDYKKVYSPAYFTSRPNLDDDLNRGHFHEYALWLARAFKFDTIADVGCGHCNMISNLQNLGKHVMGIDVSPYILQEVVKKNPALSGSLMVDTLPELAAVTAAKLKFDIVVCYQVLEHLTERDALRAIEQMYAMCNKYLILSICTDEERGREDSTHILIKPRSWWLKKLENYLLVLPGTITYNNSEEEFIIRK